MRGRQWGLLVVAAFCGAACGGDDDGVGLDGSVGRDASCTNDETCDDGQFCNGAERCASGICVAGATPCTGAERCSEDGDLCVADCSVPDADGDGEAAMACGGLDCDDSDPLAAPGNEELCDAEGRDEDCNPETLGPDRDGDGFVGVACCNGATCGTDCDDHFRGRAPGAVEVCNLADDDCDGSVDEGVQVSGYRDADGDRHGDGSSELLGCPQSPDFAFVGDDCDDADPSTPGSELLGDGADNDCDGSIDESDVIVTRPFWIDVDGDGYGDPNGTVIESSAALEGYAPIPGDCDDRDRQVHPGATERCNGVDDDCNGVIEDEDRDADGFLACATSDADCDDASADAYPGAPEVCDGVDNDCDDAIDEVCVEVDWFPDGDGDGFGTGAAVRSNVPLDGHARRDGDCDDEDADVRPGALEVCDGVDQDCDVTVDEASDLSCGGPHMGGYCVSEACRSFCEAAWDDCDMTRVNGCETSLASPASCGACGNACATGRNGAPVCVDFECGLSCAAGFLDCNDDVATDGCETYVLADEDNCGGCGVACRDGADTTATCMAGSCTYVCATGYGDCDADLGSVGTNYCETPTDRTNAHCGRCGNACGGATPICVDGGCTGWDLASDGSDGAFVFVPDVAGGSVMTLAGRHDFLGDVVIEVGRTLRVGGNGVLELYATGDVIVEGTIDASGGDGGDAVGTTCGAGGGTGNGLTLGNDPGARASGGVVGRGGKGGLSGAVTYCGFGGEYGGGNGGQGAGGGGGGGGQAGGGGGNGNVTMGGGGAGGGPDGGEGGLIRPNGGLAGGAPYNGGNATGSTVRGGGGGSIGRAAAGDLAMATTFAPGSGGGGGGTNGTTDGGGGGGGGGALRVTALGRIRIAGAVLANGGDGGGNSAANGGGGSGGAIWLAAPSLAIEGSATVSAVGGAAGAGVGPRGGAGGLGRIRVSTYEASCSISGTVTPATTCAPSGETAGRGFVATFPY